MVGQTWCRQRPEGTGRRVCVTVEPEDGKEREDTGKTPVKTPVWKDRPMLLRTWSRRGLDYTGRGSETGVAPGVCHDVIGCVTNE